PEDGWEPYDSYLTNNINIPKEFKPKQTDNTATVEVSFEVNKNGDPFNFKVEKSLCNKCDAEAIRLIKEGPKWKRKARKGRTRVAISF
ncbi:MAG TPA: energy transducer TonB, partial [Chitinophagaceae bacterium]